MKERKKKKLKSAVPAQAGGYYLQETRFFYHLLTAKLGTVVSLEYLSDVASETVDGHVIAEEDKSSIEGNPVTNRSVALWKTFSNWHNAVQNEILKLDSTKFLLYVPKRCSGNLVEKLSMADTDIDAKKALSEAKEELWGSAPIFSKKNSISRTLKPYLENVFNASDEIICKIIKGFKFETGIGSSYEEIDDLLKDEPIPLEIIDDVRRHLLGWVKEKIDKSITQGIPPCILRDDFVMEMRLYIRRANRSNLLISFASQPSYNEKQEEMKQPKVYLKQLALIEVDFDEKLKAISDYLMASVDRAQWSERGIIHEKSFDDLEDNLLRTWKSKKQRIDIVQKEKSEIEKGQLLYLDCSEHRAELEGNPVPNHYVPGSFHALSDDKKLGWHPNWNYLLSNDKKMWENRS